MPDSMQFKLSEDQFITRLRENLTVLAGAGPVETGDSIADLRRLTEGKMLRSELEARFPLGKYLSTQVTPVKTGFFARAADPMRLTGRVILHLGSLIERGIDDEPVSLGEFHSLLTGDTEIGSRYGRGSVLGLFSPTGWTEKARRFVGNDPPGTGWASERVHPVLIGPLVTDLFWNRNNHNIEDYVETFCGLTVSERQRICQDRIERLILVKEFANLAALARENGFSLEFVKNVARDMASGSKQLVVKKVSGVGWVVKRRSFK